MIAIVWRNIFTVCLYMCSCLVRSEEQFSYFALVLGWPNSYCNRAPIICNQPVPQEFKITEFNPRMPDDKTARNRNQHSFSRLDVSNWNFTEDLELNWPSLSHTRKNVAFWKVRWFYSGAFTDMTPENYFYMAIKFARKHIHLLDLLRREGKVIPSDQAYDRHTLHHGIASVIGSSPRIKCNNNNGKRQLERVTICMDRRGTSFNCTTSFFGCPRSKPILFPTEETLPKISYMS